jgi:hypothetical protein
MRRGLENSVNDQIQSNRVARGLRLVVLCLVSLSVSAFAQFGASLSGTVEDSTAAVIPGATVTLTNDANRQSQTTTSSGEGAYSFRELPPGTYSLRATAKGFKTANISNLAVGGEGASSANVVLTTGGTTDTVNVDANEIPTLQTTDASVGNTLQSEALQRLPASGGDVYELLRLAPGITGDSARSGAGTAVFLPNGAGPGQSNRGIFQAENQVQISAAGQPSSANNFLIDGVSVNSLGQAGAAVVTPNQESVAQITTLSTSYSAEDGRNSGAQIKTVTKSGSNVVHGSAYFRYDEPGLNAYNRSASGDGNTFGGIPLRVNNKIRDWAASLGGPIIKDKLFLFTSYEGFKLSNNAYITQWVETPQYDALVLASRPNTVTATILSSGGVTPRVTSVLAPTCSYYISNKLPCQIVGNGIDVGSPGPVSANGTYYDGTPALQTGAGLDGVPDLEFVQLLSPSRTRGNQFNGRMDYYATSHDQFAVSTYFTKADNVGASGATGSRPQADLPTKPLNSTGTFIYIHTFSPNVLNEFRANFTRYADNQIQDAGNSVNYGIPYIDVQNLPIGNDVEYGVPQAPTTPGVFAENTYEGQDIVTVSSGSRTLRMGFEYRTEQDNNNLAGDARPVFSFAGLFNFANNAPVYEGIYANPLTGGLPNTARYLRSNYFGGFVQHDWKISPTFTLNTGIRYEFFSPIYNKGQDVNLPTLGPAGDELGGATLTPHHSFYDADYTGVVPKFGFAWLPTSKTVVRGGVARAMNRLNFSLFDPAVEDGPGFFNFGLCCGSSTSPLAGGSIQYAVGSSNSPFSFAPNSALVTPIVNNLPVGKQIEVYGAPPVVKIPYAYLYSFEIETQIGKGFTYTIGYQGSEGHHLPRLVSQNLLFSTTNSPFTNAFFTQTDSNSNYNALNNRVVRVFRHGYQLAVSYRYAKSLDQVSNGSGADSLANQTNPANNTTEWGPSDYDTRHLLNISGLWSIPGTKGDKKPLNILTNGWQINGIYTFHTGFPFTPVTTNLASNPYVPTAATISPARPFAYFGGFQGSCKNSNYISGNDVKNTRFITSVPAGDVYSPGIGRNSFTGPCYTDLDMSFAREQKFSARNHSMTLRFQANLFNILNTLNLTPFQNGNAGGPAQIVGALPDSDPSNPSGTMVRTNSAFGRPTSADAGRQIEFFARLFF